MLRETIERIVTPEKLHIVDTLGEPVGKFWFQLRAQYAQQGEFTVASPLSSTPLPVYSWVIEHANEIPNWDSFRFILMDEMVEGNAEPFAYIDTNDPSSYEGFALKNLLNPLSKTIQLKPEVLIKPPLSDLKGFNRQIDLLILALGVKGNYANVMPGTPIETGWHIAQLIEEFRQAHTQKGSHSFEGAQFREYGMSLGPQQVLSARNIAVIISGSKKRDLTKELFAYADFEPEFPLSVVHHPKIIVNQCQHMVSEKR